MASKKFIQALELLEAEKGIQKEIVLDASTAVAEKAIRIRFMPKVIRLPTHCMAMLGRPTV